MFEYVTTRLPVVWPGTETKLRTRSRFKQIWTRTLNLLEREISAVDGTRVEIAVDTKAKDIRNDGMLRADASPGPRVIVSYMVRGENRRQSYPCDTFLYWQDNIYAIAKSLEALRMVERYGMSSQYVRAGFKALPGAGQSTTTMSVGDASLLVARLADDPNALAMIHDREWAKMLIRRAQFRTHPDRSGSNEDWTRLEEATRIITAHHGGSL